MFLRKAKLHEGFSSCLLFELISPEALPGQDLDARDLVASPNRERQRSIRVSLLFQQIYEPSSLARESKGTPHLFLGCEML